MTTTRENWMTLDDEYDVERTLGQGGMGTVYLLRRLSSQQRFAVKRMRFDDETNRRNFLSELQTWLDLPEHPHLVPCRFFRTLGEEIAIFGEYIEGGSLKDWIDEGRLYAGGPQEALARIVDIAIQFAWGLHSAHEQGLVHQDVKPGNLLLTPDGVAKVADFGLARAKAAAGEQIGTGGGSLLVSCGGMTKAYASPEQVAGQPLSRKTDTWSFAVSVLQMFTGEVTWLSGVAAPQALEGYLQADNDGSRPRMPRPLATLLQHCFVRDAARRPPLLEVAERLRTLYRDGTGQEHSRPTPAFPKAADRRQIAHDRRTTTGVQWDDPRDWLLQALTSDGRDPAEANKLLLPRAGSREAQAVADLAAYDEARRIYERLVKSGRRELKAGLATLCANKALVHQYLHDVSGALDLYDQAVPLYERLVRQEGRQELRYKLIAIYQNCASTLSARGFYYSAVAHYHRGIKLLERLVQQEGQQELRGFLAGAYQNKATAVEALGGHRNALTLYDQAIALYERLVYQEGKLELRNDLASSYLNKANVVSALGDYRSAVTLYDQAIEIRERLVQPEGQQELRGFLAGAYQNKATAVEALGGHRNALTLYDQAIALYEQLLQQEGRQELRGDIAAVQAFRASTLLSLGERARASKGARGAISVLEEEAPRTGRADLKSVLDWARSTFKEVL